MRKNAEEVASDERKALIGSPDAIHKQQKIESEGDLAESAEGITASLHRTRQQMTQVAFHDDDDFTKCTLQTFYSRSFFHIYDATIHFRTKEPSSRQGWK
jgi:hypothetical protein